MSLAGVVVVARHGDRQGFYQDPKTYTARATNLTVLGYLQEYQNGVELRNRYIDPASTNRIVGIEAEKAEDVQIKVIADGAGEGTVIVDSANAFMQGLFPPFNESITLANGTTVTWGNRAQLINIETIEADQQVWLEGYSSCNAWTQRLNAIYQSPDFTAQSSSASPFFASIQGLLGNSRPAVLENAYNVWDYLNVQSIHNSTLAPNISAEQLATARGWADYHESISFSDPDRSSVGNIAGTAMLPPLLGYLNSIANASDPTKWALIAGAYKPFLALGSLLDVPQLNSSIVNYASTLLFEVYTNNSVQALFRNGTFESGSWQPIPLLGSSMIPLSTLTDSLSRVSIPDRAAWCDICQTTDARGCDVLAAYNGTGGGASYASDTSTFGRHRVSPVTAGLIGAFVTLAVVALLSALAFVASKTRRRQQSRAAASKGAALELPSRSVDGTSLHTDASSARHLFSENNK